MPATPAVSDRRLRLDGHELSYTLRRSKRRTVGMLVDERGLRVLAPARITLAQIEAFIKEHAAWVLDKLQAASARAADRRIPLHHGAPFPVLGEDWQIRIEAGANRARWGEGHVVLALREGAEPAPVLERALKRRALELFGERLAHYGRHLGQPLPPLSLSSARTRWGSCSRRSGIRLNWRLIHLPLPLIDYVAAHELAHLVEMNHSPRFWAVVETLYPDWKAARAELKALGPTVPVF